MPGNAFIKFGALKGESLQDTHKGADGWSEINDWAFSMEADTSFLKGTGAAVGKAQPSALSISKAYDKMSIDIMKNQWQGTHFPTVTIEVLKQTGAADGKPERFYQMILESVYITVYHVSGGEDGTIRENVSMVYKKISFDYKPQENTGKLGASSKGSWDVAAMKVG